MKIIRSLQDPALPLRNTAVALGLFDGVHVGHRAVLDAVVAAAKRDCLTPCVFTFALAETDMPVKQGAAHLTSTGYMEKLLADLGMEYAVAPPFTALRGQTKEEFVTAFLRDTLGAKFISCGYNFGFGKNRGGSADDLKALAARQGIDCEIVEKVADGAEPVSSTRIRSCITAGDMPVAEKLLGRPFTIDFKVVCGNRIGRTLGSPTINQPFPEGFIIPRFGVYATLAKVDGVCYSGVTNVGVKPTVGSDGPLAETYIQGFSGNLYGKQVEVSFLEFIRPEKKFSSLEELRQNIFSNARTAAGIAEAYGMSRGIHIAVATRQLL